MQGTMGNEGINMLAGILQSRMSAMSEQPAILDIGEIGPDMSLNLNLFKQSIPQADYLVCRQLTLGATGAQLANTTQDAAHSHRVLIPEKMRKLKPGDRVLVAWVGDDPCVIDIILPGTAV